MNDSFSLVEIKGFCASIFTVDALLKNTDVSIGLEECSNGNVVLKLRGTFPQVNYALNLAIESANKISTVINFISLEKINSEVEQAFFPDNRESIAEKEIKKNQSELNLVHRQSAKDNTVIKSVESVPAKRKQKTRRSKPVQTSDALEYKVSGESKSSTIERLRLEALGKKTFQSSSIISDKSEKTKTYEIKKLSDLEGLNVHKLRRAARDFEEFPIKGRQISIANRDELMIYFKQILPE